MFSKVFEQIFDSSIAENYKVRLVFEDLLTLADINGVVDKTHEAIARRTNVPIDIVRDAIAVLEQPDPKSRRPDADGRRIIRLDEHRDWGWFIVNYQHYRDIASEEQRREKTRERVRKYRGKEQCNAPVTLSNDSPSTSASSSPVVGQQKPTREEAKKYAEELNFPGWEAWYDHFESNGWKVSGKTPMKDWKAGMRNGKRMAVQFNFGGTTRKPTVFEIKSKMTIISGKLKEKRTPELVKQYQDLEQQLLQV